MAEFEADITVTIKVRVQAQSWEEALEKVNRVSVPIPDIVTTDEVTVVDWDVADTLYVIDVAAVQLLALDKHIERSVHTSHALDHLPPKP